LRNQKSSPRRSDPTRLRKGRRPVRRLPEQILLLVLQSATNNLMRALSDHEKRTIRFAVVGMSIYLVLFGGLRCWKFLEKRRADYQHLVKEASSLRQEIRPYEDKVLLVKKLMESFRIDPAKLSRASVVGSASSAIQKAAATGGLK